MITYKEIQEALPGIEDLVKMTTDRLGSLDMRMPKQFFCIGHSGGKDSVVNHWLVTQLFQEVLPTVHTSKPGGDNAIHPDTLEFLYKLPFPVELWPRAMGSNPKYRLQFDGSRAAESNRTDRSADFIVDGRAVNRKALSLMVENSMFGMTYVYPMFDWSDAQVWATIFKYHLPFSKEYVHEQALYQRFCAGELRDPGSTPG
jgi:3'-phosphoadenosine 5'-phosphosulfate sulfotransferase (PAPS reductase)/FAD synthetase